MQVGTGFIGQIQSTIGSLYGKVTRTLFVTGAPSIRRRIHNRILGKSYQNSYNGNVHNRTGNQDREGYQNLINGHKTNSLSCRKLPEVPMHSV